MNGKGMNCAAAAGCEATQEILKELKQKNKSSELYDIVAEEFIDFKNEFSSKIPIKERIKLSVLHWIKGFVITMFALAVVLGGYWVLFRIIS